MSHAALRQRDAVPLEAPARESMGGMVRTGLRSLLAMVPALLGSGVMGALKGFFLFGCFGLALAGVFVLAPRWTGAAPTPAWLDVLSFVLTPLALAVSGGYVWMLHGVSSRLASEVRARGLMGYAYAILKPATLQAAKRLRGAATPSRAELTRAIEASVAERMQEPEEERESAASRAGWLEGFLMDQSRRVLGLIALRAVLTSPDVPTAVR